MHPVACKHGVRHRLENGGGAVVCIVSPCGIMGFCTNEPAYSASKAGVMSMARAMAADYVERGIRVNVVIPGLIDTPMNDYVMQDSVLREKWTSGIPMKRAGTAEEAAAVITFLASNEASYVTGSSYVVEWRSDDHVIAASPPWPGPRGTTGQMSTTTPSSTTW